MKKIISKCMLLAAFIPFTLTSCDNSKTSETNTNADSLTNADTGMDSKMDNTMNKMAQDTGMNHDNMAMGTSGPNDFMMKAAGGGMMEVEMGQLAQKNAESKSVKDFGKMMETDHTKANNELKKLASDKNVTLPATMPEEHMMHMNEMKAKTGADFDKAYITMMVEDHNKDIELFEKTAADHPDADIKNFATKTLPVLKKHLAKAKEIQGKL